MMRCISISLVFALAGSACGDDDPMPSGRSGDAGVAGDAAPSASGDGGAEPSACPAGDPVLEPLDSEGRFAVVSTDRTSSSVTVLDADGQPLLESWVNSGTTAPGLVATLSGDVALPTTMPEGSLVVLDRLMTDVVSRFCRPGGSLVGQVRTHGEDAAETGFSSNPQDFVIVGEREAWVSRYSGNADSSVDPINAGSDLLGVDPWDMTLNGERIDLSSLSGTGTEMTDDGPQEVTVYPRPASMLRIGDYLVVGLDRMSLSFMSASEGMVAIVDLTDRGVSSYTLDGMANCGGLSPVVGEDRDVLVACKGFSQPYGVEEMVRASSGVFQLRIDEAGEVTEVASWRPVDDEGSAVAVQNVVSLGDGLFSGVDFGSFDPPSGDRLVVTSLSSGAQDVVVEADNAFALGPAAFDPSSGLLLVPDADHGIRRIDVVDGTATERDVIEVAPSLGLPVASVHRL